MKRSFTTAAISFLTVAFVASMYINTSAFGAFIRAEPDNYPENSAIPDNIGVKLRNCDYPPNHPEFNRPWRRIYAKSVSPSSWIKCPPTTGFLVLGNDTCHYYNGYNYGLRAFFDSPTSFVSFDILWATRTDGSEGAYVTVYGNDINGNEVTIFSGGYRPSGSHTTFSLSHAGITRLKVICWDDPRYFRQKAFSVDDFRFIDTSGTAWTLQEGDVIEAPNGFDLGGDDSLGGNGVINGDVNNAGLITPGESVGQIIHPRVELEEAPRRSGLSSGALVDKFVHLGDGRESGQPFLRKPQGRAQAGRGIGVDGQDRVTLVTKGIGQQAGERGLSDAALSGDRKFHDRTSSIRRMGC